MSNSISPGFIALHGNRAEDLAQTVIDWLRRQPLGPLEEEVVLVQSNGMAEWFKMELARRHGVCSATRVELPSRFLWRTYRQVLGPRAVPRDSPLDKLPMTWRVMKVLPTLLDQPEFAPVKGYLRPDEPDRQLQLASKLADLFDQYQNYRADWLEAWASGQDILIQPDGSSVPVPADQCWQPQLWRAILTTLAEAEHEAIRPRLHQRVLESLQGPDNYAGKVARRVVVYGMSHLPGAMLETLAALSRHSQVMLAVPNPCRYYWGDIIEGRELLKSQRRRQGLRNKTELSSVALEDMHQHAHPLLAAWGRQGRDFIRQLDAYDDPEATRRNFSLPRIDIFDEVPEDGQTPLLNRVQNRIRDLEPLHDESAEITISPDDRSIIFQIAHSKVRELEVLQDHLLHLLDQESTQGKPLHPRDIVVMVPDIEVMAPAIRAVFGQYQRHDKRYIPFDIADLSAKSSNPIITSVEWLLRLPSQRCRMSELLDILEVPALAKRFDLEAEQLTRLTQWMAGAGIRWGLNLEHRQTLGLAACGEQNSAWFGLQRMLLGYACGTLTDLSDPQGWDDIEPYAEIGGLDAELAGTLAHLIKALTDWWSLAVQEATPAEWVQRGRDLIVSMFKAVDELDQKSLSALDDALTSWASACEQAGFDEPLDVSALRQAWIQALNVPSLERRFRAGGITFCTLMPMRAVPFEVVCLLGMNDGDYPRRTMNSDFDLMTMAGQLRPGDRSRRQDDRQLMLEALLSARRLLYVSWTGRSVRDNSEQPPSVLVSQLRDYLSAVWGEDVVKQRTTSHPLQPFSRRYFEDGAALQTFAREWGTLHEKDGKADKAAIPSLSVFAQDPAVPLTLQRLTTFFRNPVKVFFRERLGVAFEDPDEDAPDEEPFEVKGLENYQLIKDQVQSWPDATQCADLPEKIPTALQQLRRSGALPMEGFGDLKENELAQSLGAMALAWRTAGAQFPYLAARIPIEVVHCGVVLRDWIDQLHQDSPEGGTTAWMQLEPAKVLDKEGKARPEKLLAAWLRSLSAAACGHPVHGVLVGQDGTLRITPMLQEEATEQLHLLLLTWLEGMQGPLPLPLKTGLTVALGITTGKDQNPDGVYEGDDFDASMAEVNDACLARMFPDFETLTTELSPDKTVSRLQALSEDVYVPMLRWVQQHVTQEMAP